MAENKKSFLLYCDTMHTVEKLTDTQAGVLFKHLLRYVNDLDPEPQDIITEIAFEPIKQSLKRDLRKYETIREKKREAGLRSAEVRKQQLTPVECVEHMPTHSTVNDSVSVSVSVSDSVIKEDNAPKGADVILKEKKIKPKKEAAQLPLCSPALLEAWERWKKYKKDQYNFSYKSTISEIAGFNEMLNLAKNDEQIAIKIIEQSITKTWKGLFELKISSNGNTKAQTAAGQVSPKLAGTMAVLARFNKDLAMASGGPESNGTTVQRQEH